MNSVRLVSKLTYDIFWFLSWFVLPVSLVYHTLCYSWSYCGRVLCHSVEAGIWFDWRRACALNCAIMAKCFGVFMFVLFLASD